MARFPSATSVLCLAGAVLLTALRPAEAGEFHFTVTADPRSNVTGFESVLAGIQTRVGGIGAFHVSPGDIDPPAGIRGAIDSRFGTAAIWYPGIGNHEAETPEDMDWLRAEYASGQDGRPALKTLTNQNGPEGSVQTMYSWDHGNAHFVMLNEYWSGGTADGSDVATDGEVGAALREWLAADLAASAKPFTFVFGHEPAFPENRHVGDSLDQYPSDRDAFWGLLTAEGAAAYVCGHTHVYSTHQEGGAGPWQIDVGNAGNDGGDGFTFLDVTVSDTEARFDVWRDGGGGTFSLASSWSVTPEPASALILLLAVPAFVRRHSRQRA